MPTAPTPAGGPSLVARGLWRTFGEGPEATVAVADVSLEVSPGEFVLLMGPSGSGKSTLVAMLAGLLRPTRGRVVARGVDLWRLTEPGREDFRRRTCGFVFQGYNLFPSLTVREQLELVARWTNPRRPAGAARATVDRTLRDLGMGHRADALPSRLSGGEKQRAAIARALLNDPAFVFADEPTSALDWAHGEQAVRLLVDAARTRGATVVTVTHDHRLLPYGDRVYHLADGRLERVEAGPGGAAPAAAAGGRADHG